MQPQSGLGVELVAAHADAHTRGIVHDHHVAGVGAALDVVDLDALHGAHRLLGGLGRGQRLKIGQRRDLRIVGDRRGLGRGRRDHDQARVGGLLHLAHLVAREDCVHLRGAVVEVRDELQRAGLQHGDGQQVAHGLGRPAKGHPAGAIQRGDKQHKHGQHRQRRAPGDAADFALAAQLCPARACGRVGFLLYSHFCSFLRNDTVPIIPV